MCGLTGFSKSPESGATATEIARAAFPRLMGEIEQRGKHATGVAICDGPKDFIWKVAEPWQKVKDSKPWNEVVMPAITDDITTVIGHTRWATQNNAQLDSCAHPFRHGKVVGAHNGVIHNWIEIEKELGLKPPIYVDSQAAFALLDAYKEPADALNKLQGYFALTWWKQGSLYMARSGAPIFCAYVPALRLLVWNSVEWNIKRVFAHLDIKESEYKIWGLNEGDIYKYTPSLFDDKGTNVEKHKGAFKIESTPKGWNSARPTVTHSFTSGGGKRGNKRGSKAGTQTHWVTTDGQTYLPFDKDTTATTILSQNTAVVDESFKEPPLDVKKIRDAMLERLQKGGQISLKDIVEEMANMAVVLAVQARMLKSGQRRLLDVEKDLRELFDSLDDVNAYLQDLSNEQADADIDQCKLESPYKEDPADSQTFEDLRRQLADVPSSEKPKTAIIAAPKCDKCGFGMEAGKLLRTPGGGLIHERCVFETMERAQ